MYLSFAQGGWGPVQGWSTSCGPPAIRSAMSTPCASWCSGRTRAFRCPNVKSQSAWIDQTINQEITFARLCTAFAILALVIACVGLYGTMSYSVARRTSEIGIRMALGAQRGRVVWMVLREVFCWRPSALAISVPAALAASKLVESFLFGMKPNDPLALTAAVTLVIAAILAGYLPARHASRIDPMSRTAARVG